MSVSAGTETSPEPSSTHWDPLWSVGSPQAPPQSSLSRYQRYLSLKTSSSYLLHIRGMQRGWFPPSPPPSPLRVFFVFFFYFFFYITNSCLEWVKGRRMLLQVWWTRESGDGDDFCLFVLFLCAFFFFLNVNFTPPSFAGVVQRSWQSAVCHVLLNLAKMRSVFGHPSRSNTTKSCCA